jgi:hypothetical protein
MSALYIMRYLGGTGAEFGGVYIGRRTIVGADVGNGRYSGNYSESGGRMRGHVTLTLPDGGILVTGQQVPPGTSISMSFDWPQNFTNGAQQIFVQGKPVSVNFEKVGNIP